MGTLWTTVSGFESLPPSQPHPQGAPPPIPRTQVHGETLRLRSRCASAGWSGVGPLFFAQQLSTDQSLLRAVPAACRLASRRTAGQPCRRIGRDVAWRDAEQECRQQSSESERSHDPPRCRPRSGRDLTEGLRREPPATTPEVPGEWRSASGAGSPERQGFRKMPMTASANATEAGVPNNRTRILEQPSRTRGIGHRATSRNGTRGSAAWIARANAGAVVLSDVVRKDDELPTGTGSGVLRARGT
jgi:hypothetical protein